MKEYPVFLEDGMSWGYIEYRCIAGGPLEIIDEKFTVTYLEARDSHVE